METIKLSKKTMNIYREQLNVIYGKSTVDNWTDDQCTIQALHNKLASMERFTNSLKEVLNELIKSKRSVFLDLDVSTATKKECYIICNYSPTILNTDE